MTTGNYTAENTGIISSLPLFTRRNPVSQTRVSPKNRSPTYNLPLDMQMNFTLPNGRNPRIKREQILAIMDWFSLPNTQQGKARARQMLNAYKKEILDQEASAVYQDRDWMFQKWEQKARQEQAYAETNQP